MLVPPPKQGTTGCPCNQPCNWRQEACCQVIQASKGNMAKVARVAMMINHLVAMLCHILFPGLPPQRAVKQTVVVRIKRGRKRGNSWHKAVKHLEETLKMDKSMLKASARVLQSTFHEKMSSSQFGRLLHEARRKLDASTGCSNLPDLLAATPSTSKMQHRITFVNIMQQALTNADLLHNIAAFDTQPCVSIRIKSQHNQKAVEERSLHLACAVTTGGTWGPIILPDIKGDGERYAKQHYIAALECLQSYMSPQSTTNTTSWSEGRAAHGKSTHNTCSSPQHGCHVLSCVPMHNCVHSSATPHQFDANAIHQHMV